MQYEFFFKRAETWTQSVLTPKPVLVPFSTQKSQKDL